MLQSDDAQSEREDVRPAAADRTGSARDSVPSSEMTEPMPRGVILVSKRWLAPMTLALLCAGSGWRTTASAQDADAQNSKLVFAVVMRQIFNQGNLALVDDFVAEDVTNNGAPLGRDGFKTLVKDLRTIAPDLKIRVDEVVTRGDRLIGHVTQMGGGASEGRIILLRIDGGVVHEYWSWAAQPELLGLHAAGALHSAASAK